MKAKLITAEQEIETLRQGNNSSNNIVSTAVDIADKMEEFEGRLLEKDVVINGLKESHRLLEKERDALNIDVKSLVEREGALKDSLAQSSANVVQLRNEIHAIVPKHASAVENMRIQLEERTQTIDDMEKRMNVLFEENKGMISMRQALSEEVSVLKERLSGTEATNQRDIQQLRGVLNETETRLKASEQTLHSSQDTHHASLEELSKLKALLGEYEAKQGDKQGLELTMQKEFDSIMEEKSDLLSSNRSLLEQIDSLKQSLVDMEAKYNDEKTLRHSSDVQLDEIKQKFEADMNHERTEHGMQLQDLNTIVHNLQAELEVMKHRHDSSKAEEGHEMEATIIDLRAAVDTSAAELSRANDEIVKYKKLADALNQNIVELKKEIEATSQGKRNIKCIVIIDSEPKLYFSTLSPALDESKQSVQLLESRIQESDSMVAALNTELNGLRNTELSLRSHISDLEDQCAKLQSSQERELGDLQSLTVELQDSNSSKDKEILNIKKELDDLQVKYMDSEAQNVKLQEVVTSLEGQVGDLEIKLNKLKTLVPKYKASELKVQELESRLTELSTVQGATTDEMNRQLKERIQVLEDANSKSKVAEEHLQIANSKAVAL